MNQKMEVEKTKIEEDKVENDLETEEQFLLESTEWESPISAEGGIPSVSSGRSGAAASLVGHRRRSSSSTSSSEEVMLASSAGLASSHGRLSSCSTVMVMEEQLMLNPTKAEVGGKPYKQIFRCSLH